jgi:hypothetical protein
MRKGVKLSKEVGEELRGAQTRQEAPRGGEDHNGMTDTVGEKPVTNSRTETTILLLTAKSGQVRPQAIENSLSTVPRSRDSQEVAENLRS